MLYYPDVVDAALDLLTKKGFRFAEEKESAGVGRRQLTGPWQACRQTSPHHPHHLTSHPHRCSLP